MPQLARKDDDDPSVPPLQPVAGTQQGVQPTRADGLGLTQVDEQTCSPGVDGTLEVVCQVSYGVRLDRTSSANQRHEYGF
jgi:hypothetical protein